MRLLGLRLHVLEIDDAAVASDKCDGQGQVGIMHPEASHLRVFVNEQHALVASQCAAIHQALAVFVVGSRHFGLNDVHSGQ